MSRLTEHIEAERRKRIRRGTDRSLAPTPDETLVDLASNDYLGLRRDRMLISAAAAALERYGTTSAGSRNVTGNLPVHRELEAELRGLTSAPALRLTTSGYLANLAALTALVPHDGYVVLDEHAHASLVDGARLSRRPIHWVQHNDTNHLRRLLERNGPGAMVVTESVFSVLGDAAPLESWHEACSSFDATLLIDEAHGLGVVREGGEGGAAAAGLLGKRNVVITGSLGKACASQGGFIAGPPDVVDHLTSSARPLIYDTAPAPATAAAATAAARRLRSEPALAHRARANAGTLAQALGLAAPAGAIITAPLRRDSSVDVVAAAREAGFLLGLFRPDSTPDAVPRVRITARASLGVDELRRSASFLSSLRPLMHNN